MTEATATAIRTRFERMTRLTEVNTVLREADRLQGQLYTVVCEEIDGYTRFCASVARERLTARSN